MKNPSPYLKMRVLGAIENADGRTKEQRIKNVANLVFVDEDGVKRQFTWRTISTWYYRYKNYGITEMINKERRDKGMPRKTTPEELLEAINEAMPHFKPGSTPTMAAIYRFCIEKGILSRNTIAYNTFTRLLREFDLLDKSKEENPRRLAFAMQYANDLWQADTMFGPYVQNGDKKIQSKLIAFIDDASRVVCHGQFFPNEKTDSLVESIRNAFYKRGIPRQLYVDNGSIYCCAELTLICARVGCILRHTPVRDGAAKGKIERFFRTVREQFLIRKLDLSSLEVLNKQFHHWLEDEYNCRKHSVLGMAPIDRFAIDRDKVSFLPPSETTEELFFMEKSVAVGRDNTFRFNSKRYETPVHLAEKKAVIRYHRIHKDPVVVYYKDQRMGEARIVDLIANGRLKRRGKEGRK